MDGSISSEYINGLDYRTFHAIIDSMYDEVLVYDRNMNIVYINQASCRHYGYPPEEMIGKNFRELIGSEWWMPSILPVVIREKRAYAIRQETYLGVKLLTLAVPIFNRQNEVEYVVMNVRDEINEHDLYNPRYVYAEKKADSDPVPVYESPVMKDTIRTVNKVSQLDVPCLIFGEVGVGKTVISRYIHNNSARSNAPFVILNCETAATDYFEHELSVLYNSAENENSIFNSANHGTLLLKNISSLSTASQACLNEILSLKRDMDVRILATSSINLQSMVNSGQFEENLFFALNVADIYIPPLRKRREDIRSLIYYYQNKYNKKYKINKQFSMDAISAMEKAEWRGNVKELKHVIERLMVMSDNLLIDTGQLPPSLFGIVDESAVDLRISAGHNTGLTELMERYEALIVQDAYKKKHTSRGVAELLGISQTKANKLILKYVRQQ